MPKRSQNILLPSLIAAFWWDGLGTAPGMPPFDDTTRLHSLTDAQRQLLRFVAEGLTSKQIAQRTGGSHHTINVQIGIAMRILGATSRQQAAAMLSEAAKSGSYDSSYKQQTIVAPPSSREETPHSENLREYQQWAVPIPTKTRPANSLSVGQRLAWVLVIATIVALLLGGLVSGVTTMLTGLGRLG